MFKVLENNKEDLLKSSNQYNCEDDIYGLLLKTGKYINAKDIIYLIIKILFLIKIISNKSRKLDQKKKTPLHYAALKNSKEMLEILISKGADINVIDIIYLNIKRLFLINII